eukprot:scaffold185824_cov47-Attheya_sp.AAC.4
MGIAVPDVLSTLVPSRRYCAMALGAPGGSRLETFIGPGSPQFHGRDVVVPKRCRMYSCEQGLAVSRGFKPHLEHAETRSPCNSVVRVALFDCSVLDVFFSTVEERERLRHVAIAAKQS